MSNRQPNRDCYKHTIARIITQQKGMTASLTRMHKSRIFENSPLSSSNSQNEENIVIYICSECHESNYHNKQRSNHVIINSNKNIKKSSHINTTTNHNSKYKSNYCKNNQLCNSNSRQQALLRSLNTMKYTNRYKTKYSNKLK